MLCSLVFILIIMMSAFHLERLVGLHMTCIFFFISLLITAVVNDRMFDSENELKSFGCIFLFL